MANEGPTMRNCVGALIFSNEGKILLGQRSSKKKTEVGKWQFPQGGVEVDEDEYVAVLREVWEEIGLNPEHLQLVQKLDRRLIYTHPKPRNHAGQTVQWFIFYMSTPDLKLCKLDNEEMPEFTILRWGSWDDLLQDCPSNKHEMFGILRTTAAPVINTYIGSVEK